MTIVYLNVAKAERSLARFPDAESAGQWLRGFMDGGKFKPVPKDATKAFKAGHEIGKEARTRAIAQNVADMCVQSNDSEYK